MKKYFWTGLAILAPVAFTVAITLFLINILTTPFLGITQAILARLHLFQEGFLFLSKEQVIVLCSEALILLFLFGITILLGALTRWFFVHYLLRLGDSVIHRIPVVNAVYKTSQEVIKTLFSDTATAFKKVALVPFPHAHMRTIGFVTREHVPGPNGESYASVFVPTTPNPTSGFLMLFHEKDITQLDMPVEDAFKFIISCGVIASPFDSKTAPALPPALHNPIQPQ